jgi:transposase InsO family protein
VHVEQFCRYGIPQQIRSDNVPAFCSNLVSEFNKYFEVEHHFTVPYHYQSNAIIEKANQEELRHLRE